MVARGVRSRALSAHPFSNRLYSAPVRYDDHRQRNWFYRSLSPLGRRRLGARYAGIGSFWLKAAAPTVGRQVLVMSAASEREFEPAFAKLVRPAGALLVSGSPVFTE
jgi:hypothetical protein